MPQRSKFQVLILGSWTSRSWSAGWRAFRWARLTRRSSAWVLELPMPDGHTESFTVVNSPIMAPELAARFPQDSSLCRARGGVARRHGAFRFDPTRVPRHGHERRRDGLHRPLPPWKRGSVICYTRSAFYASTSKQLEGCMALETPDHKPSVMDADGHGGKKVKTMGRPLVASNRVDNGTQLRTYRLALACALANTPNTMEETCRASWRR